MRCFYIAILALVSFGLIAQETTVRGTSARDILKKCAKSVVTIEVERNAMKDPKPLEPSFFPSPFAERPKKMYTTGFAYSDDGYVLTSYFNVMGDVKKIRVSPAGSSEFKDANLVGYDSSYDVALLKVNTKLKPLIKAPKVEVGDVVFSIGTNPDGDGFNIDDGVVGGMGRFFGKFIQTDNKLNYGNTGGPLVNLNGDLVGMCCKVSTKFANTYGQNSGVSFAIPVDKLDELFDKLKKGIKVTRSTRPFLGIEFDQGYEGEGVRIKNVMAGTAAEKGGLQNGDVIVDFGGDKVESFQQLRNMILKRKAGEKVKVVVKRGDDEKELTITLGTRDEDE